MKIIDAQHLKYSYSENETAVRDVSFSLDEGEYVTLVGHNGSGKSTIAKLLMGLLEPNEHAVFAFGKELTRETVHEIRSRIGIVFQNPDNQFVGATVRDDIAFGLENRCMPREEIGPTIEKHAKKVNMLEYLDKEPENLSGGQKQRVAIAGVLSMNPDLVIFDEATSMLDPKGKREIYETIHRMKQENPKMTILSITHDIEEAYYSDRVIGMNNGEIVFDGNPKELLQDEDKLLSMGLDSPFIVKLQHRLAKEGLTIQGDTIDEVVEELCR